MLYFVLAEKIINTGYSITQSEANALINCPDSDVFALAGAANQIKHHYLGNKVRLCSLINAKSGQCSEDCSFCAQSGHFNTGVESFPLVDQNKIVKSAQAAQEENATCFSIVTSGKGVNTASDFKTICSSINEMNKTIDLNSCASLGIMSKDQLIELKNSGLKRFHHNLETSRSFFPAICTTHSYDDRIQTIKDAKEAGLEVCCGGIFGLGETAEQRIELAFTLKDLNVESIPLNILHPIEGTKSEKAPSLTPMEAFRTIAVYRFIFPGKDIGVLGGRESRLGDLQAFVLVCGANVILLGNYLTTKGRPASSDIAMIKNLGLEVV